MNPLRVFTGMVTRVLLSFVNGMPINQDIRYISSNHDNLVRLVTYGLKWEISLEGKLNNSKYGSDLLVGACNVR